MKNKYFVKIHGNTMLVPEIPIKNAETTMNDPENIINATRSSRYNSEKLWISGRIHKIT